MERFWKFGAMEIGGGGEIIGFIEKTVQLLNMATGQGNGILMENILNPKLKIYNNGKDYYIEFDYIKSEYSSKYKHKIRISKNKTITYYINDFLYRSVTL